MGSLPWSVFKIHSYNFPARSNLLCKVCRKKRRWYQIAVFMCIIW